MKLTIANIKKSLASLGKSPGAIAKSLKARKIKGLQKEPGYCPIAMFLFSKFNKGVFVNGSFIEVGEQRTHTPKPITNFISTFDSGAYPELLQENEE